ncbi:MAG: TRAP transporter small permease subunit [Alphaproteobacteria bacterium]|jgi:TRAP-type mannitol/chloroaromatic compound transport system permease small subunit|nr:TRAP transporter small permease subunit [Alphaproteobacteria bacterium]
MVAIVRLIERFSLLIGTIGAVVMAPLVLSMVYEVLMRHFFNAPTFWAYEIGYMLAGTCYMFGMGYCLRQGGHIRVDFLYQGMSLKGKATVNTVGYIFLMIPVCAWVTWGLYEYAVEAYVTGEVSGESAWNPIIWPFRVVWFLGFVSLTLQGIAELIKNVMILQGIDIAQYGFGATEEATG